MMQAHDRYAGDRHRLLPFVTSLGEDRKLGFTDEGFLICREVALSRIGEQVYTAAEVPEVEPGPDGTVIVERHPEDVFDPQAIASFSGKPFTDEHPEEDVDPLNFAEHLKGAIQNPRRGEGERAHLMLGDIIVYAQDTIDEILGGKREISLGYNTKFVQIAPGRARQIRIRGNHGSLVERGRAGPICAILDHAPALERAMSEVQQRARDARAPAVPAPAKTVDKKTVFARLRDALRGAKDEDAVEAAIAAAEADAPEGDGSTVVVNVTQAAPDAPLDPATVAAMKTDPAPPATDRARDDDMTEVVQSAVTEAVRPLGEKIDALSARLDALEGRADETDENMEALAEETGVDVTSAQDAMSGAEIIAPGLSFPARDAAAKPGTKAARAYPLVVMRSALSEGLKVADHAPVIRAIVGHRDIGKLTPNETAMAFRAARDRIAAANNAKRGRGFALAAARDGGNPLAFINERNRAARAALAGK